MVRLISHLLGSYVTHILRKKGAGGLLAYIRNDLSAYRRLKLESSDIESICLDVKDSNNSRFIVCACYRSPTKCKESDFLASLSTATENMYNTRKGAAFTRRLQYGHV